MQMLDMQHLAWARRHDWGEDARLEDGAIVNLIDYVMEAGQWVQTRVSFDDFDELRAWAGY